METWMERTGMVSPCTHPCVITCTIEEVCVVCAGIRRRAGNREVSAGERYSKFEVISDSEIVGRKRLNHSPDLREMRRARDSLLRSKKPTGSKPGVSKVACTSGFVPVFVFIKC